MPGRYERGPATEVVRQCQTKSYNDLLRCGLDPSREELELTKGFEPPTL